MCGMRSEANKKETQQKQRAAYLQKRDRRQRSGRRTQDKKKKWGKS